MDGVTGKKLAAEVARTTAAEPGRLQRYRATGVLALLSAAALAPVALSGGSAASLVGVVGNIGGGVLSAAIDRALGRWHVLHKKSAEPEALRDELATELRTMLERGDSAANDLRRELTDLLMRIGGVEAAVQAAGEELRGHLLACFGELAAQQSEALRKLGVIADQQRRQGRQQRDQTALIEEMLDRQRMLGRILAEGRLSLQPDRSAQSGAPSVITPIAVPQAGPALSGFTWGGGAEVAIGDCVYLLYSDFAQERFSADHSVLLRQARGVRLVPAGSPGNEYIWLRQAEVRRWNPAARAEVEALTAEGGLLAERATIRGLPRVIQRMTDAHTAALALSWPASRSTGGPCGTVQNALRTSATPLDSWRTFRLLTGLAGLCGSLALLHDSGLSHRYLTPSSIIVLDDGRLVLRDLGLAARDPHPGEGPADYQAPEQRGRGQPGPATDVYQMAAVAYHLLAGHPPHPRMPLPLRSQAPAVPGWAAAVADAALASHPGDRPGIGSLGRALRTAHDTCAEE